MLKSLRILLIFAFLFSIEFSSISAESQKVSNDFTYVPTNDSLIVRNIVIVIDSSASTTNEDPTTHISVFGLIDANAINIISDLGRCSYAGVVVFGGETKTTDMVPISNDTYKAQLEKFIRDNSPAKGEDNPTDINSGLLSAQELLGLLNGTKEIIVISDGFISPESIDKSINTVMDLKNKNIGIQFIQVNNEKSKEPFISYAKLAQASNGQVMVLNPDERVRISQQPAIESNEPCITLTPTIFLNRTVTVNQTPVPSSLSTPINQNAETRTEEIKTRKAQGFEGILTIFSFLIYITLRYKI